MPLLQIDLPRDQIEAIRARLTLSIDAARQQLVQDTALAVTEEIARSVPVDTGDTQRAWEAETARIATSQPTSSGSQSSHTASVNVEQMQYIEYGTSRIPARAPIRSTLARLTGTLGALFRLV